MLFWARHPRADRQCRVPEAEVQAADVCGTGADGRLVQGDIDSFKNSPVRLRAMAGRYNMGAFGFGGGGR